MALFRRVPGSFTIRDLAPFAHRSEGEHADDRHTTGADPGPDEQPEPLRGGTVAIALQINERVPDQSAGEPTKQNCDETDHAGSDGRNC